MGFWEETCLKWVSYDRSVISEYVGRRYGRKREKTRQVSQRYHVREFELYFGHGRAFEGFCSWKLLT